MIRLAAAAGVPTDAALPPAQQLRQVQELARQGHPAARRIFRDMGVCLAHTLALYAEIYPLRHVMVLGRVASGIGGAVCWRRSTLSCRWRCCCRTIASAASDSPWPPPVFRRCARNAAIPESADLSERCVPVGTPCSVCRLERLAQ